MKIAVYLFAVLAIILLVGCAQTEPTVTQEEELPEAETPTTIPQEMPDVQETPKAAASEIEILVAGFDPEELTVKKGTTVKWINTAPATKVITVDGKSSGNLASGTTYEHTFDKAGTYKIFDLFGKKWGNVVVTE